MYWGQLPKGGGAWTVCDLGGGGLCKKEGSAVFEGSGVFKEGVGLIPQCTL